VYSEAEDDEVTFSYREIAAYASNPSKLKEMINNGKLFSSIVEKNEKSSSKLAQAKISPPEESSAKPLAKPFAEPEIIERLKTIEKISTEALDVAKAKSRNVETGFAYAEANNKPTPSYEDGSDNSPINKEEVRETGKAKDMEDGFISSTLDTIKEDGKEAAYRIAVKQTIKTVKAPLIAAFASRAGGSNKR